MSQASDSKVFVALLRGINVGGRHKLPMKDLKSILEELGFTDVHTYIQSGNVVLSAGNDVPEDPAGAISDAIEARFGFRPSVWLVPADEFRAMAARCPFKTDEGKTLHFSFLEAAPSSPDLAKLEELKSATEAFALIDDTFYLHAPDGIGRSKLAAAVERSLGVDATVRNWNTVRKLLELIAAAGVDS